MSENTNIKYIGTKVNGINSIVKLNACNMCPFLKFEPHSKTAYCNNPKENNLIKKPIITTHSYMYNDGYHYPLNNIQIPNWCNLYNFVSDVISHNKITYQLSGNIYTDTIPNFTDFNIYSDKKLKFNGCKLEHNAVSYNNKNTLPQCINNTNNKNSSISTPYVKKDTCSLCGEYKDNVNRSNNLGMCNDCWNKISDKKNSENDDIYFAYINNFRLKRKSTYARSQFKKVLNNIKII